MAVGFCLAFIATPLLSALWLSEWGVPAYGRMTISSGGMAGMAARQTSHGHGIFPSPLLCMEGTDSSALREPVTWFFDGARPYRHGVAY